MKNIKKLFTAKTATLLVSSFIIASCGGNSSPSNTTQASTNEEVELKALSENDTSIDEVDTSLSTIELPSINTNEETVSFSQVLDDSHIASNTSSAYTKTSRSFSLNVDADKLSKGLIVPTTTKDPLIRIIPNQQANKVNVQDIEIQRSGTWIPAKDAFKTIATQAELKAAGINASENTLALRLKSSDENINLHLKAANAKHGQYKIHVLEPSSDKVLALNIDDNRILKGNALKLNAKLTEADNKKLDLHDVEGFILSPSGQQKFPFEIHVNDDGEINSQVDTSSLKTSQPGLWEMHISTKHSSNQGAILRDAKVAFALSPKTARLNKSVSIIQAQDDGEAIQLSFNVETAVAGRYELSAIIYGQNENQELVPGILASQAKWLDESGNITLDFPQDKLLEAGIEKPYEIRHLSLRDQTRMAELWLQEKALTIQ